MTDLSPQAVLLLQQDDCAPDALDSFLADFPLYSGGLSLEEFKSKACILDVEDVDNGFAIYWYLGPLILSISADDPFYSLHTTSPPNCAARRTPMTDLSPQAQAVQEAAFSSYWSAEQAGKVTRTSALFTEVIAAAALEAAADQVVPEQVEPPCGETEPWPQGYQLMRDAQWEKCQQLRAELLAIAAELRGQDQQHTGQESFDD